MLSDLRRTAAAESADSVIERLYRLTSYPQIMRALPDGEVRLGNLRLLEKQAADLESVGVHGLSAFLRAVDRMEQSSEKSKTAGYTGFGGNCVSLLTVHGSKGLEFPVVFLCGTSKQFNSSAQEQILLHPDLGFACKRGDGLKASRYQKPCRIFSACGGAALYRKSILDKIGVFDELFFAYYEDVDLSWRANNFGYKNVYCPTAKCRHICGATTGAVRYNPFKSIQSGRNSILLPYKNQPVVMLVVNFIPMLLGYLLKVIMFRHRGFGNDYAKGYAEAKIALPKIKKPKFYWRNLPNYLWCEGSMIVGLFRYLVYRVQRALKIT